ncbi:MAG TPA: amidase family protein, partial [Ilumatobacteraceae bacterium]
MGIANDLASLDATAQAELVREGAASRTELVQAAIEAAERINPLINAVIHPRYDAALAEAAESNDAGGPFAGVPMVVKDLGCMMKGEPYHLGSRGLKAVGYRAPVDSALYRRFRAAGFIAIG